MDTLREVKSYMGFWGWTDQGNPGSVKKDVDGQVIAHHGDAAWIADVQKACDTIDRLAARAAVTNGREQMTELYDVIEVGMDKPHKVEVLDVLLGWKHADAAVKRMATARQGTPHFFKAVPAGAYKDGQPFRFS